MSSIWHCPIKWYFRFYISVCPMTYQFSISRFFGLVFLLPLLFSSCKEKATTDKQHKFTNALIDETSPYLLQHAHNPVNWRAWTQEALDDAKKENKLVLVSIGYSSCHWCHVMEEETFEDEEVAKIMNENFISIKVDREERPDIDQIYQIAIQMINNNEGGWPLNAIVLPNGKPIYLGTYHTKEQWSQVLVRMSKLYHEDPEKAEEYADGLANGIQDVNSITPSSDFKNISKKTLVESIENWKQNWDLEWGGDLGDQKFMIPVNLSFLLDYAVLNNDALAKAHVKNTLDKMVMGGVYDHVGGGFFRYSTDAQWKIPHFEKMLYDNAQLLSLYSKAYTVYKDLNYRKIVLEIAGFLEREMKNVEGGYYAAIDSESEGEEGEYYIWQAEELKEVLKEDIDLFSKYYNVQTDKVWENGTYVLHNLIDDKAFSKTNKVSIADLNTAKTQWKKVLLEVRKKRVVPKTDDKIIISWNALLINGFVDAYKAFGQKEFLDRAEGIFEFIREKGFRKNQLVHSYKKNSKRSDGFLEDYAFLIDASLNLYGATLKSDYLDFAMKLNEQVETKFADAPSGMYTFSENQELISKIIKTDDGFWPSPNAVMAHNLFRLGHINYDTELLKKSTAMLSAMVPMVKMYASNYSKWNSLVIHNTYPFYEIVVVGKNALPLIQSLNQEYIANALVIGSTLESELPLFKGRYIDDNTFIYVCQNSTCKLPVATVEEAMAQLEKF